MSDVNVEVIVCLWQYKKPSTKDKRNLSYNPWQLVKSYVSDGNYDPIRGDDDIMYNWIFGDDDRIKGRAITIWNFNRGATIHTLTPPDYVEWLDNASFIKYIEGSGDWCEFIQGSYDMYLATCDEARKLVRGYHD